MPETDEQNPPTPSTGGDTVTISKAEHDRIQAENRRAATDRRERERAALAETARQDRDAADAEALRNQLAERDRRDTLRDAIYERQFTASQSKLVLQLADLSDAAFDAVTHIDTISAEYPDLFAAPAETPTPPEPRVPQPPSMRRAGPAPTPPQKNSPFEGYISPEDYNGYPPKVRLSAKFRERVELSRPYWPTHFNPHNFPQS